MGREAQGRMMPATLRDVSSLGTITPTSLLPHSPVKPGTGKGEERKMLRHPNLVDPRTRELT